MMRYGNIFPINVLFTVAGVTISIALMVLEFVGWWRMFEKAGIAGWKSLIPFYNMYCLSGIALGNGWLFLLSLVPVVNVIYGIILAYATAKAFGKGVWFAVLIAFLPSLAHMILGFSDARYFGPVR